MAKDLRRAFRFYNRKYFNNELPEVDLCWKKIDSRLFGYCDGDQIVIHENLRETTSLWKLTLLHELVHLKNMRWGHGKKFQNEMRRLANAGAFDGLW